MIALQMLTTKFQEAMTQYYGGKEEHRGKDQKGESEPESPVNSLFPPAIWRTFQQGPNDEYSRYLRPCCENISSSEYSVRTTLISCL
jgi:hypothetical protein